MKNVIGLIIILLCHSYCWAEQRGVFDVLISPSITDKNLDFWFYTPKAHGPDVSKVSCVYPYQPLMLLMFARVEPVGEQKRAEVEYDLKVISPEKKTIIDERGIQYNTIEFPFEKLLLPDNITDIYCDEEEPFGEYQISTTFREKVSGRTYSTSTSFELIEFEKPKPFTSQEEFGSWVEKYYRSPQPVRSLAGIVQFVELDSEWIKEYSMFLAFYSQVLQDNPFLWKYFFQMFSQVSAEEKKKLLLVAAISSDHEEKEVFLNQLSPDMKAIYSQMKDIELSDIEDVKIKKAEQLDMLWAKFLASGKYWPVRKIISALSLKEHEEILDRLKNKEIEYTDDLKDQVMLAAVYKSAMWSLISNCMQHELVHQYCITTYERESLEPVVKESLQIVLYVVQKKKQEESNQTDSKEY